MGNKKIKRISTFAAIIYVAFVVLGLTLAAVSIIGFSNSDAEGWEGLGLALVTVILAAYGFIYAGVALTPMILRCFSIKYPLKTPLTAICIPFDIILSILDTVLLVGALTSEKPSPMGIALFAALLALSVAAFIINIIGISAIRRENSLGKSE